MWFNNDNRVLYLAYVRSHKWMHISLVLLAFCNILIGTLAFEFLNYSVLATLAVISAKTCALHTQVNARGELKVD